MALLALQQSKITGTTVAYAAASAGGDTFQYSGDTALRVKNGSGASITVTVVTPGNTQFGQPQPDIPIPVAAGAEVVIGPLTMDLVDSATGLISVTYSSATSVTVALVAH
jgi:hypothetical protein